jgi:hypothetical protein
VNTITVQCSGCTDIDCIACRITRAHGVGLIDGDTYYELAAAIPLPVVDCLTCEHYDDSPMPIAKIQQLGLAIRDWHECEAGEPPVCTCNSKRQCQKYQPARIP